MWGLLILSVIVVYLLYKYSVVPLQHWKKEGIPCGKAWPLFGSMLPIVMKKMSFVEWFQKSYNEFPNNRYNGTFAFNMPVVVIKDVELIKKITIKDFDHFTDHNSSAINDKTDPLFSKNLLALSGEKWKDMRGILSPAFTSSKMKGMFFIMKECAKEFVNFFTAKDEPLIELDIKEVLNKFTNDVIASAAFGVTCNSFEDEKNEFYKMGQDIANVNGLRGIKIMILTFLPAISKYFRIRIFPEASDFFSKLVVDSIKVRQEKNIIRPDMIHLLMEAQKGRLRHEEEASNAVDTGFATVSESNTNPASIKKRQELSDVDIAAQAILFFFAGFDTASVTMSFLLTELAINTDVQSKLQEEIDEVLDNGEVTYDILLKMKYLDMVVSETLRRWSPAPVIERQCVKDYTIPAELDHEFDFTIKKGLSVHIPITGLHHDPKYFPNPNKFDPERFNDENKNNIVPYTYAPFGIGPRNCIGSRFALLEVKIMVFHLLSKFNVVPTKDTCIPIKLDTQSRMVPKNGFKLGLEKRKLT